MKNENLKIGINGEIMNKKAIIAMSGGVDSSVAAYLIKKQGYECIGATMKLFSNDDVNVSREKSCCSLSDVEDARSVCLRLDIPYYVFNFSDKFNECVIDKFVNAYLSGATPNPCIECNRSLKFDKMFLRMKELGYDCVVTGHYAVIEQDKNTGRYLLKKARDLTKDQSYVLYMLTQEQLSSTIFPLGKLLKSEAREIALQNGFVNASKKDSQDICFVPDGDYSAFIEKYTGRKDKCGSFVSSDGHIFGEHKGISHYTIGQRKGLGISYSCPLYVTDIRPGTNEVVLGTEEELYSSSLIAENVNLISVGKISSPMRIKAKVRYRHTEQPAVVTGLENGRIHIKFDQPQRAITKGQAVVMYDGDTVVGGGTICEVNV